MQLHRPPRPACQRQGSRDHERCSELFRPAPYASAPSGEAPAEDEKTPVGYSDAVLGIASWPGTTTAWRFASQCWNGWRHAGSAHRHAARRAATRRHSSRRCSRSHGRRIRESLRRHRAAVGTARHAIVHRYVAEPAGQRHTDRHAGVHAAPARSCLGLPRLQPIGSGARCSHGRSSRSRHAGRCVPALRSGLAGIGPGRSRTAAWHAGAPAI